MPAEQTGWRVDERTVAQYLDRLERQADASGGFEHRSADRFRYSAEKLTIELLHDEQVQHRQLAVPRNLSQRGLCVLLDRFVYPGTPCALGLQPLHGGPARVRGRVSRCRYLEGSGTLYELGVSLDRPLDVAQFSRHARRIAVLVVDTNPGAQHLFVGLLEGRRADVVGVTSAADAIETCEQSSLDLVLVDMDRPGLDAFALARELRRRGQLGAIVGMTASADESLAERCAEAELTGYLPKPITRDSLAQLMEALPGEPLLSTLADDPAMGLLIDRYVARLRQEARELAAVLSRGDVESLRVTAMRVRAEAGSYGFQDISDEASRVESLATLGATLEMLKPATMDLVHLCLAARPARPAGCDPVGDLLGGLHD